VFVNSTPAQFHAGLSEHDRRMLALRIGERLGRARLVLATGHFPRSMNRRLHATRRPSDPVFEYST